MQNRGIKLGLNPDVKTH